MAHWNAVFQGFGNIGKGNITNDYWIRLDEELIESGCRTRPETCIRTGVKYRSRGPLR